MTNPAEIFLATMHAPGNGSTTTRAGHASRESGLLIASSTDGVSFQNISPCTEPLYRPASGVRDPILLYWQGQWYMAHSYGENILPLVFLVKSSDLVHWTPMGSLRLATDADNNFIDCPQWIVDPAGNVRLIACVDNHHHWVDIHPLSQDPETWDNQADWS